MVKYLIVSYQCEGNDLHYTLGLMKTKGQQK